MQDKQILVVPREYLEPLAIGEHSVKRMTIAQIHSILQEHGMYIDRALAETDPRYKQVIPYIVVRRPRLTPPLEDTTPSLLLCYVRTTKSGETRLVGKHSVGFGGHIKAEEGSSPIAAVARGMTREIEEELRFPTSVDVGDPMFYGLINDDMTDVGRVHIGLLYVLDVKDRPKMANAYLGITSPDDDISELKWRNATQLTDVSLFEDWSQLAIRALYPAT